MNVAIKLGESETRLEAAEVRTLKDALLRMGLLFEGESVELVALTGGVSARIVRVAISSRVLCVKQALPKLRVKADWAAPVSRNAVEVAWLRMVSQLAPDSVPRVLGEDRQSSTFAMAYLDPATHPVWKEEMREGRADTGVAEALAHLLLRIHNSTAGDPEMIQTFATDDSFSALRLEPYFGAAGISHPELAETLQRLSDKTLAEKRAVVHGDVSPKNVLIGPKGPLLLDAECAWYGDPAFDVAFCLTHLLLKCALRPSSAEAYLSTFDTLTSTYLEGITWEPPRALESRAAALLPALLLARIDGKSPIEYITTEEGRERVRAFAKPLIIEAPSNLASIRLAWTQSRAYE